MQDITALIEIPQGSRTKFEMNKKTGKIEVDRFLHTAMYFPFNYGFVPDTLAEDGDPTDILILSNDATAPGATAKVHLIGMLEMEDEAGRDTKLVAVFPAKVDPVYGAWQDISDVPEATKNMIKHFFEHYKDLEEGKWAKVGNWLGRVEAEKVLAADLTRFKK